MSYYESNFYQNPQPYDSTDEGEPVPGWGLSARSYAQPRVGVGTLAASALKSRFVASSADSAVMTSAMPAVRSVMAQQAADAPIDEVSDVPWYVWIGSSAAIVGLAGFAYYRGWLG